MRVGVVGGAGGTSELDVVQVDGTGSGGFEVESQSVVVCSETKSTEGDGEVVPGVLRVGAGDVVIEVDGGEDGVGLVQGFIAVILLGFLYLDLFGGW